MQEQKQKTQTQQPVVPAKPEPITRLPTGEFFRKETKPGSGKEYGYGITGYDTDGNPQYVYLGTTPKGQAFTGEPKAMDPKTTVGAAQLDEAVKQYKKSLEKLNQAE